MSPLICYTHHCDHHLHCCCYYCYNYSWNISGTIIFNSSEGEMMQKEKMVELAHTIMNSSDFIAHSDLVNNLT